MVEFITTEYQFSHGRTPRGRGSWAFQVGSTIFWATSEVNGVRSSSMTYSEAKRIAADRARAAGVRRVQVLP